MNIPHDSWLIQESLKKIAQGSNVFAEWAQKNRDKIDNKFLNLLEKMVKYARETGNIDVVKPLAFLKSCFDKMFDVTPTTPIAIAGENFKQLWGEATLHLSKGKPRKALHILKALLLFLSQNPNPQCEHLLYGNLGIAYAQIKEPVRAIDYLAKALNGTLEKRDRERILTNLGTVYRDGENFEEAVKCYREAMEIAQERHDLSIEVVHWNNLSLVYLDKKDIKEAISYQEKAVELAEKSGVSHVIQDSLMRLALLMELVGNLSKSRELCERALKLSSTISQK